jgi:hypothetical protein
MTIDAWLRNFSDRSRAQRRDYCLIRHARVIAMRENISLRK